METQQRARVGGAFHWSAGGWFGAQIGSTLWLVVLGIVLTMQDDSSPGTAIIALAVAVNGIGLLLWEHRHRVGPYSAIQVLVAVVGAAALVAFVLLDRASAWDLSGTQGGTRPPYAVLIVFPAMMAFFALQEHVARRAQRSQREEVPPARAGRHS